MNIVGKWGLNILIWLDQGLNTLSGGDPDETVSSRLGRVKKAHSGTIPWTCPLSKTLDWCLEQIDENHSIEAIEPPSHYDDDLRGKL